MKKLYSLIPLILLIYLSCEDKKDDEDTTLIPSTNPTEVTLWGVDYSVEDTYTLDLSDNQLTGEIPSEIGNLTNLEGLTLSHNQLSGELPIEIRNLANLSTLDLAENQLSGSPFDILLDLENLDYLYLHDNQFSGYIPVTVCESLYAITAGDNQFCPPYPYCFVYAEYQDISNCP